VRVPAVWRTLFAASLLLAALGPVAAVAPAHGRDSDKGCNVRLEGLETLSDPQRKLVDLQPKTTTAAAINALPRPRPTRTRSTDFTRRVWRVTAQITEFKLEGDGDIRLVLFDENSYLIAEMPSAKCLSKKTRDRRAIIAARKKFEAACGKPTRNWKKLGAVAIVSGVGFFDVPHTETPHAGNFAELRPVTAIRFVSGCGA
jgi:hypothetical protein